MIGVTSFGAYLPRRRLPGSVLGAGGPGQTALAGFDEDSLTMAVAAATDCLDGLDRSSLDGLYLATTTPPYLEKQIATMAATAMDLRQDLLTADFGQSLRAALAALRAAADAVAAGTVDRILVGAADTRLGRPGSAEERSFGHGAAAVLLGRDKVLAALEASHSVSREILDVWRPLGSPFVRAWEKRFTTTEGYLKAMAAAVTGLLEKTGLDPEGIDRLILAGPDPKSPQILARQLGFNKERLFANPFHGLIGDTGTAQPLLLLAAALEDAQPGQTILLAGYGQGADAFLFRVTDEIKNLSVKRGVKSQLDSGRCVDDYRTYLLQRGLLAEADPVYPIPLGHTSVPALYRETARNIRFHAARCRQCGTVQHPPQRICVNCNTQDDFEPVRLSDKRACLFSFSLDHVSSQVDSPAGVAVVDFEGGGRVECYLTEFGDQMPSVDIEVEMTFRRLFIREGISNYCWKARPVSPDPGGN